MAAAAIILALLTTGMYTCDSFIYAYAEDTGTSTSSQSTAVTSSQSQPSVEGSGLASTKENAASESGGAVPQITIPASNILMAQ